MDNPRKPAADNRKRPSSHKKTVPSFCRVRLLCCCVCPRKPGLIPAGIVHIVAAGILCLVLAGITAAVLGLVLTGVAAGVLRTVLAGIAAGILGAVLLRIHGIGSMAVSAVVHITVMISHNVSLLFGL